MKIYTSGEVARLLGIPFNKLLYLENTGKIDPAKRTGTYKRYYTKEDLEMLKEQLKKIKKHERTNV